MEMTEAATQMTLPAVQITDPGVSGGAKLGAATAVQDNIAALGGPWANSPTLIQSGVVSVFHHDFTSNAWILDSELTPWDANSIDQFGTSLVMLYSASGLNRILVGSPHHTFGGASSAGVAYMFEQQVSNSSQWANVTTLTPPDPQLNACVHPRSPIFFLSWPNLPLTCSFWFSSY